MTAALLSRLAPLLFLLAPWALLFAMEAYGVIKGVALRDPTQGFIVLCLLLFCAGFIATRFPVMPSGPLRRHTRFRVTFGQFDSVIVPSLVIGLVGVALRAADFLFFRDLDYSAGLGAVRLQNIENVAAVGPGARPLSLIGYLMLNIGVAGALVAALVMDSATAKLRRLLTLCVCVFASSIILEGGRSYFVITLALVGAALFLRRGRGSVGAALAGLLTPRSIGLGLTIAAAVLCVFAYVLLSRYEALGINAVQIVTAIEQSFGVEVDRDRLPENDFVAAALVGFTLYLANSLSELEILLSEDIEFALGRHNFWQINAFLARLGVLEPFEHASIRERVGTFVTGIGDLYTDFGTAGAYAAAVALGMMFGISWRAYVRSGHPAFGAVATFLTCWCAFSPWFSIFPSFLGVLLFAVVISHLLAPRTSMPAPIRK